MRSTDVTVVLHERVSTGSASFGPGGRQLLGVLRVMTDEGVEGNSFLSRPGPEGYVHAPTGPGLGVGVDWPLINSSVTAVAG